MPRTTNSPIIFSEEELNWVRSGYDISPEIYFEKFRASAYHAQDEHQRYSRLLEKGGFCKDCYKTFRGVFDAWKANKSQDFWLDRRTERSAKRTAAKLVEDSEPYASQSIERNASKTLERERRRRRLDTIEGTTGNETEGDSESSSSAAEVPVVKVDLTRAQATPFYDLIEYLFKKTRGETATLPAIPRSFESSNFGEIYRSAHAQLASQNGGNKDTLTVLSGIINTISPAGQEFTLSPRIKSESLVSSLTSRLPCVEVLLKELLNALSPNYDNDPHGEITLIGLQVKVWKLLAESATDGLPKSKEQRATMMVLKAVSQICSLLENRQLQPPHSEHVFVSVWSNIMNLLFQDSLIRVIPGELTSAAAKDSRTMVEEEFGLTTRYICGRKVDLSVRVYADHTWQNEIAVYEFKTATLSDATCLQQQQKSVRLNGAILLDLERRGVDIRHQFPIIAEGRGLALDFYTLRRYEDILVQAGPPHPECGYRRTRSNSGSS
ncbi:hypothetical protein BGW41_004577 [Actinomortierella wolfii]|nr:hypothetical protein BGW41_004577 [Actinomortierella wolfii]